MSTLDPHKSFAVASLGLLIICLVGIAVIGVMTARIRKKSDADLARALARGDFVFRYRSAVLDDEAYPTQERITRYRRLPPFEAMCNDTARTDWSDYLDGTTPTPGTERTRCDSHPIPPDNADNAPRASRADEA